jgi:hypothetical protein
MKIDSFTGSRYHYEAPTKKSIQYFITDRKYLTLISPFKNKNFDIEKNLVITLGQMSFEEYLLSKKIDSTAFKSGELSLWQNWQVEFEQVHPHSFTAQKLYLINPLRRKYPLATDIKQAELPGAAKTTAPLGVEQETAVKTGELPKPNSTKPAIPKPIVRPKPKTN